LSSFINNNNIEIIFDEFNILISRYKIHDTNKSIPDRILSLIYSH